MTEENLRSTPTDELIRQFRVTARRVSFPLPNSDRTKFQPTPERAAAVARLRALSGELRARHPVAEARSLFEDEDRDVRALASLQLSSIDPELASATFSGVLYRVTGKEILSLRQRALTLPPERPSLTEMSTDALVARFEDAATREYASRFVDKDDPSDVTIYNRISVEVWGIVEEFKRRDALAALLPLLDSPIITVRAEAARATLTIAPERASAALQAIADGGDKWERFWAARSLETWRAGKTVIFGVG